MPVAVAKRAVSRRPAQPSGSTPLLSPASHGIQRDARVGASDDMHEREARQAAEVVLSRSLPSLEAVEPPAPRRQPQAASGGSPLEPRLQAEMEQRFRQDFSHVRIHSGAEAERSADGLNARAYALGSNIVFGRGQYAPDTPSGRRLLAHELAHVVQQSGGSRGPVALAADSGTIRRDDKPDSNGDIYGSRQLKSGVLIWSFRRGKDGPAAAPQVRFIFSPFKDRRSRPITFLQTIVRTSDANKGAPPPASIDMLTQGREGASNSDLDPFYGALWDNTQHQWIAENDEAGKRMQPGNVLKVDPSGSATDPNAYFFDQPYVYPGQIKEFETMIVIPETTEILASIRWTVTGSGVSFKESDVAEAPSAQAVQAIQRFYAKPDKIGPDIERDQHYDAILDAFPANDGTSKVSATDLSESQKKDLQPVIERLKQNPAYRVEIGGFADATEKDPGKTSDLRMHSLGNYLISQGIDRSRIIVAGAFGAAWARVTPGAGVTANRRVQVRIVP